MGIGSPDFIFNLKLRFWEDFALEYSILKSKSRRFLALQNLGDCLSEFSFVGLLKLVESFALIIYVRSDLAYFEGKSNENSPRQPPRFCNAKNLLLLLFKMLYSKAKSSQKRSFKLKMKSGDPIPILIVNVGIWSANLIFNLNLNLLS